MKYYAILNDETIVTQVVLAPEFMKKDDWIEIGFENTVAVGSLFKDGEFSDPEKQ